MSPPSLKRSLGSSGREISPPPSKRQTTGTASKAVVANFFTPLSQKAPEKVTFHIINESLLVARFNNAPSKELTSPIKIAAFDFDDTIITTKSGNRFARGPEDWKWWHATVPARLAELHSQGYCTVIISNQAAVSLKSDSKTPKAGMLSLNNFKAKTKSVFNALDLPIVLYAATQHDTFRKPRTGMWTQLLADLQSINDNDIDRENSMFVGDAAGREADKTTGQLRDHSCSDRNFATNIAIPFFTPEEFFLNEPARPYIQPFDPRGYLPSETSASPSVNFKKLHELDIVLFCGSPGAGKSTFFWQFLEPLGYNRVNQDILKSRDRCLKVATEFVKDGKSVVVDNTNADIDTRALWVKLARSLNVPIRLIHFTAPVKLCEHNDAVRGLNGNIMNPEQRTVLPRMAFSGFTSRYREPTLAEGFTDIVTVDFSFRGDDEQLAIWNKHWT